MLDIIPTRRDLLLAAGGLFISLGLPGRPQAAEVPAIPLGKPVSLDQVDSFLAIGPDGRVTVYSGKVDLGTGVRTAITQIVAEELDVAPEHITVISGDTALTPDQGASSGSNSIQVGGVQIRQAAATARQALLDLAAKHLQVAASALSVQAGQVTGGGQTVPYGVLLANRTFALAVNKEAPTKNPADFKIVGTSFARLDIPDKVTGRFTYMHQVTVDGMLHGRVVRPPAMGAALLTVDEASVKDVPGLVKVVRDGNFLGVVAKTEWGAIKASQNLKATWSDWAGLPEQAKLFEHVRATKIDKDDITSNAGDAAAATEKAARKLTATYDFAIHTHGSIGPSCAIVATEKGQLT